ncbi:aspartate 4-decarboxylase [Alicyclobacillus tolerans]|uniref:aspartate 4-decarboxylase n=1 Tax=Alicyclobacillus tolerans TaxID=90970 RepID=UPI001F010DED|nr:aspartate 4-decarboxylase [Alicyclobacillus tolerans]MCF8564117.1 aspartate 4-decarboxylase [Alicyclobacillus tolerans]
MDIDLMNPARTVSKENGRQLEESAPLQDRAGPEANADRARREMEKSYETISPFEFKNKLIALAQENEKKSTRAMLNAGRGNPNWIAATPREAFFALGQFAVEESRRVWNERDLAGKPSQEGIASRFNQFVNRRSQEPGVKLLSDVVDYGITTKGFDANEWIYELVDGIVGDNYPMPDRMLVRIEQVVHDFVVQELCGGQVNNNATGMTGKTVATVVDVSNGGGQQPDGQFQLFAVEGATAAMCYIFDSLLENYLLARGDKVAIMVPVFPPYVEIPHLHKYSFEVIEIKASAVDEQGRHTWQYPKEELEKLSDPSIKALFLVNPSNPPSVAIRQESTQQLIEIVNRHNPNLMIISDDVYSTFVDNYRSLMADLPYNTIGVYSFSKYFGVTGWRLGVVAVHEENVFDYRLKQLPPDKVDILNQRYGSLTQHPEEISFIDRMVADSRQVALRHTAGLSTPQQVQMALFAAFALLDKENRYKQLTKDICHRRIRLLYDGLGLPYPNLPHDADYYTEFDLAEWASHHYSSDFTDYLQKTYEPVDILFRLAEQSSIVLLNGGGFHGPIWSIRVSLANLDDDAYAEIGRELHKVLQQYVSEWESRSRR